MQNTAAHSATVERHRSVMRYALAGAFVIKIALAQPTAVLEDLEQRALQALSKTQRAGSWPAAQKSRNDLQRKLIAAIGLESAPAGRPISAFAYAPKKTMGRVPAVIILRTHADGDDAAFALLGTALAQLEMVVIELDARADHSTFSHLAEGVAPQGLIQQDVRSVLAYLKANAAVDSTRLGLVGEGLAGTIAAAINPELSAAVVLDGAPDFAKVLNNLRHVTSNQSPDSCLLLPGILHFA
ncbi:MAG TPA: hypothetical protein VER03_04115, partial [Bryobacteraceae bacterium]|nr:hypothetical protein [Bryobacteraceae bacterium]